MPTLDRGCPPPQSKHRSVTVQVSKNSCRLPAPGIPPMFRSCSLGVHQGSERTKQYRLPRPAGALVIVGLGAACGGQSLPACIMVQLLAQIQTHPKTLGVCQTFYLLFVCKIGRAEGSPNTVQDRWVAGPAYSPAKPGQNGGWGPHSGLPLCAYLLAAPHVCTSTCSLLAPVHPRSLQPLPFPEQAASTGP